MKLLKGTRCYLAGPVDNDENADSWRNQITSSLLVPLGITVYDPLVKAEWMTDKTKVNPRLYYEHLYSGEIARQEYVFDALAELRAVCMAAVSAAEFIICHLPKTTFTWGTIDEIQHMRKSNKPVFFHAPDGVPSTWGLEQFAKPYNWEQVFFKNWHDLTEHILQIDNGEVELDPIQWFSVAHEQDKLKLWNFTRSLAASR